MASLLPFPSPHSSAALPNPAPQIIAHLAKPSPSSPPSLHRCPISHITADRKVLNATMQTHTHGILPKPRRRRHTGPPERGRLCGAAALLAKEMPQSTSVLLTGCRVLQLYAVLRLACAGCRYWARLLRAMWWATVLLSHCVVRWSAGWLAGLHAVLYHTLPQLVGLEHAECFNAYGVLVRAGVLCGSVVGLVQ